jgi:hypothetical protein
MQSCVAFACCNSIQNLLSSRLLYNNVRTKIHRTIILNLVLYGFETSHLILGEEHRLKVFENRVLRRIFGPKRDEVTGSWRKLQNEELHNLYKYKYNNQIKEDEMGRICSKDGEEECIEDFGGKARRKETSRRPRRRWEDNSKMNLREIEWGGMVWIHLVQDGDQCRGS